ncbi:MAG: RNA-binding protein [Bacteroidia bacterium]|nr:RNA-binding protein [Bacteroidia bacterium]
MRIYIGNLNYRLRTEELKNEFLPFGEVIGAKIVRDLETKRSKGFGFVEMVNEADGLRAIEALNGHDLKGRNMIVTQAKPRENADVSENHNQEN